MVRDSLHYPLENIKEKELDAWLIKASFWTKFTFTQLVVYSFSYSSKVLG